VRGDVRAGAKLGILEYSVETAMVALASTHSRFARLTASVSIVLLVIFAIIAIGVQPAGAQSHTYSTAAEFSQGSVYTGLIVHRYDDTDWAVTYSAPCDQLEVAPIAYETEWVIMSGSRWVEIGTGHRCDNFRYWYWGYRDSTGWHRLGYQTGLTTTARDFRLQRRPPYYWDYWIDGTLIGFKYYAVPPVGYELQAGLESYDAFAIIPWHAYASLRYSVYDGSFVYWSGEDGHIRDTGMCGSWDYATAWLAGEHC
jgi:hypothetical protein